MLPRRRIRSRAALACLLVLFAVSFSWNGIRLHIQAALLLTQSASANRHTPLWLSKMFLYPVRLQECRIPLKDRALRAYIYQPVGVKRAPGIALIHGIHYLGRNEPRIVSFANALSATGITVLTPEVPELAAYRVEPATIGAISASARYMAALTGRAKSGVIGISFAGGLALLAAADPVLQKPIGYVVGLGAHCDMSRVALFYAGKQARDPSGTIYPVRPHPYGARVMLFSYLNRLFSAEDLTGAQEAMLLYLHDRHRDALERAKLLSEAGRAKMRRILDESDPNAISSDVLAQVSANQRALAHISPCGQLARVNAPVLLIHGEDDPVVPSTETLWLARQVPKEWLRWTLVSPVLRHAEVGPKNALLQYWELVRFMADLLSYAHRLPMQ